jgi:hypothetical protein
MKSVNKKPLTPEMLSHFTKDDLIAAIISHNKESCYPIDIKTLYHSKWNRLQELSSQMREKNLKELKLWKDNYAEKYNSLLKQIQNTHDLKELEKLTKDFDFIQAKLDYILEEHKKIAKLEGEADKLIFID